MSKGHYESDGYTWEQGEVPECDYCGKTPEKTTLYETATNGIYVCDEGGCAVEYVMSEGSMIEWVDGD
tara:strand:- start:1137 stop:1340 length:204 start_codon:yes stop_codon:yes gene_type:complete